MDNFKILKTLDLSNFVVYSALSSGYAWFSPEMVEKVSSMMKIHQTIDTVVADPMILNYIGLELLNMPYIMNQNGVFEFIIPVLLDTESDHIEKKQVVGEVYKKIIRPISVSKKIPFINPTTFILYNDRIEVADTRDLTDVNILNIVINVISVYIIQQYKKGTENG